MVIVWRAHPPIAKLDEPVTKDVVVGVAQPALPKIEVRPGATMLCAIRPEDHCCLTAAVADGKVMTVPVSQAPIPYLDRV